MATATSCYNTTAIAKVYAPDLPGPSTTPHLRRKLLDDGTIDQMQWAFVESRTKGLIDKFEVKCDDVDNDGLANA